MASLIALLVKNLPECRRPRLDSWGRKIRWRRDRLPIPLFLGFPCGSASKESTCNVGDLDSISGLGRYPGEGKGLPTPACLAWRTHGMYRITMRSQRVRHDWVTLTFILFFASKFRQYFVVSRNPLLSVCSSGKWQTKKCKLERWVWQCNIRDWKWEVYHCLDKR